MSIPEDAGDVVVEDKELNAEIVVELLKYEGASCDVAENGQSVVD